MCRVGGVEMEETRHEVFVGIDWATEEHQISAVDAQGKEFEKRKVENSGEGIGQFLEWVDQLSEGDPGRVGIAIEVPRGAMVESLVERGYAVYSVNPKQLDRFRDRYSPAGCKDDERDAMVLADSLRTDGALFKRVRLDGAEVIRLRELSRMEDEYREEQNRLCNRLRELLLRYFPQVLKLSSALDDVWVWDLLEMAPSPVEAARLTEGKIAKVLRKYRIRRVDAGTVAEVVRSEPLRVAPGVVEAASEHIRFLLPRLRLLRSQRAQCVRRIEELIEHMGDKEDQKSEHRDVAILLSMPGVGRVVVATMLAEASQPLTERDYHAFRTYGGTAPVTQSSGKRKGKRAKVIMRRGCNARLRTAFYHWARIATQKDELSRAHYAGLRQRGHSHGRALRGVADRLLKVAVAMLRNRTLYDPTLRHRTGVGSSHEAGPAASPPLVA